MSNKKSTRSKKGDGSDNLNFVFNLGGGGTPTTPSFNFSGSQPGSPLGSPGIGGGGFNFPNSQPSSPASTSFNFGAGGSAASLAGGSQPFVFGDSSTATPGSPSLNTSFSFGAATSLAAAAPSTNSPFATKRNQSDLTGTEQQQPGQLRRTNSDFSFSVASPTTSTSAFSFGGTPTASPVFTSASTTTSAPAANAAAPKLTSAFSFGGGAGSSNTTAATTSQPSFGSTGSQISFSSPAAPASTSNAAAGVGTGSTTGGFSFGSTTPAATTSTSTSPIKIPAPTTNSAAGNGFTFGSPAKSTAAPASSTTTPTFSFGSSSTSAKPTGLTTPTTFSFGSSTTDKAATPSTSTASTTAPTFSFGKPATETPKASTASATTSAATTASPFTFGTPSKPAQDKLASTTPTTTSAAGSSSTTTTAPTFSFGTPPKLTTSTSTSSSTTSSTPVFSFGSPATATGGSTGASSPAATTATSTSSTTTPVSAPSSSLFSLGTVSGYKDGKKTDSKAAPTFSFGAGASTPTPGSSSTTAGGTTIPSLTTTIDLNKPNPFSFTKILDDLAKVASQPPSQMYANLITPSALAALQNNQVVHHTNFRIDNILPSTRFTELPEQAQKELDELEKYVRTEGSRCEYIQKNKVPEHINAMEKAKRDTETLSQQLDALSSTLKGQMKSIEVFYENVKEQSRWTNDGCAVIEACKVPGNSARWLFGYSEDDDYFNLLAKELSGRLEEYKRCIWEIERTAESWTHYKVQSPQDIADIMRTQNQAFLALSNKVAALHESVAMEQNNYNQYLKMYASY